MQCGIADSEIINGRARYQPSWTSINAQLEHAGDRGYEVVSPMKAMDLRP